jgi:ribosomal protein L28
MYVSRRSIDRSSAGASAITLWCYKLYYFFFIDKCLIIELARSVRTVLPSHGGWGHCLRLFTSQPAENVVELHANPRFVREMGGGKKAATVCSRALRGLFAGRTVRHGNNVSEDGGNRWARGSKFAPRWADPARPRTRRMWKPNAQRKRVYSELLGHMVPLSLTTHTLRCIDKAGGARQPHEPHPTRRADARAQVWTPTC